MDSQSLHSRWRIGWMTFGNQDRKNILDRRRCIPFSGDEALSSLKMPIRVGLTISTSGTGGISGVRIFMILPQGHRTPSMLHLVLLVVFGSGNSIQSGAVCSE